MKRKSILLASVALSVVTASAQINSPQSGGYEARAAAMLADGNFRGCIDQCRTALELGSQKRELCAWLSAVAAFNGGLPEAQKYVNAYLRTFPDGAHAVSARLLAATLTFYQEDYSKALKQFDEIKPNTLNDNEREDLAYRRAYSLIKLGEYEKALPLMKELSATKRYGAAATFYEAYIAYIDNDYEEAFRLFEQCDKTEAPGDMADYYVAQMLFDKKDYAGTLNRLMPLMARKDVAPEFNDEIERIAGECYYALHDDNRAMVFLNEYMRKHASDAPLSTRYIVGCERYQTGDYDEALELLAPVSQLNDEMGQSASLTMGQSYMSAGNVKSAIICFDKAMRKDFNPRLTETAYYNYAVAQVDGGRVPFGNSVQTLEDFLKRYPKSRYAGNVREYLVKGYMQTDDYAGALRSLNSMADNHTSAMDEARQRVNFVLGTRTLQAGDNSKAISYLTEAMKYGGSNADIERQTSLWLGDAYYASGQYGKAAGEYKAYIASTNAKDPNHRLAQYNLGYAEYAERHYAAARKMFEGVISGRDVSSAMKQDSYNRIGDTYYYGKSFDAAKSAYQKAYDVKPGAGDYSLLQMAMMEGHLGNYNGKMATLQKLVKEMPKSSQRPVALTEMALTYGLQGNTNSAIGLYKKLTAEYSTSQYGRNAMLQLAILSDNSGNTAAAKEYYRQVISDYPTSAEAVLAVQDLKRIYGDEGQILELDAFLSGIKDAPQLDATERNAIAAASLLAKASKSVSANERFAAAKELLDKYPDAVEAEDALLIAAKAQADMGFPGKALEYYIKLEQDASTASLRHTALLGIVRAAAELGDKPRVMAVSSELLEDPASTGVNLPEIKFLRALSANDDEAVRLWTELAEEPANIYGTRSGYELANHYYVKGELATANKQAEALIDANPPHAYWLARTFILYSDILRAQGSDFEADEYLRVLRSNYPGTESDIFQMIDKRLPQ